MTTAAGTETTTPTGSQAGAGDASHSNRRLAAILLGIAVAFTLAVLVGARLVMQRAADQPVAMPVVPAPQAGSAECAEFVDALPGTVLGYGRAELAAPAPEGAAAWQKSSTERVTLRCGVDMPLQYTTLSQPEEIGGARWLEVRDDAPGSTLSTWFTTDRAPVIAVTADAQSGRGAVEGIDVTRLPRTAPAPAPAPLSQLAGGDASACRGFAEAAPEHIAEGFSLVDAPLADPNTVAWTAPGREPVVVRCGVAAPEHYRAGVRLAQVNGTPWFEDTETGGAAGTATWYALGRAAQVAAFIPAAGGNEVITNLTDFIAGAVPPA